MSHINNMAPPIIDVTPVMAAFSTSSSSSSTSPDLTHNPELRACVDAIRAACINWGFFQCTHHGIPDDVLEHFDHECRSFFELPLSVKRPIKRTATNSRGWFDDELTKQIRDWKECIDIGQPGKSKVDGENQWPSASAAPAFRPAMERYYHHCWVLSRALLRACAVGLGMAPNHFDEEAEPHTSYLRLNYYPVCGQKIAPDTHGYDEPDPEHEGSLGINKHSDAGCLTVLRQYPDQPSSLQVYQDDRWHRVVPMKGALTINIGDMMQVWSNGLYKAPLHRVLADRERVRYSAPFFYNPSYQTMVTPVKSAGVPKYHPLSWAEFRRRRFEGDFGDYSADVQISDWLIKGGKYGGGGLTSSRL
jgi:isopenicillin N synthase-like dioxygenase